MQGFNNNRFDESIFNGVNSEIVPGTNMFIPSDELAKTPTLEDLGYSFEVGV